MNCIGPQINSTLADANWTMIVLRPTELRIDEWYIRIYILWMNLLTQIIGPFILLIVLNVRTYNKIKDFERTLNDTLRIRGEIQYTLKTPNENH